MYKFENDKKMYEHNILNNDMETIMISNSTSNKSFVILSINIGSLNNDVEGIAHFLEHMIFMGNEKYPKENHFFETINKYGGSTNAFTSNNYTCYYFSVDKEHLSESIDIFYNFFVSPLFDKNSISREILAVHSEYEKNMSIENRKIDEILKELTSVDHPYKNFDCGNKNTLDVDNIQQSLIDFYNKHYSSHLMKLIISSNHSLDELKKFSKKFEKIPKKKVDCLQLTFPIVNNNKKNCVHYIEMCSTDNKNKLCVVWQLKYDNIFLNKPLYYISYILQIYCVNSLHYFLCQNEYIYSLDVSYENSAYDNSCIGDTFMLFLIFVLTPKGLKQKNFIINCLNWYLNFIKTNAINKKIYNNLVSLERTKSLFRDNNNVDDLIKISINMHLYNNPKTYINHNNLFTEFDEEFINNVNFYLKQMAIKHSIILDVSKHNNYENTTKWYFAEYNRYDLFSDYVPEINKDVKFQIKLNPYVDSRLKVHKYDKIYNIPFKKDNFWLKNIDYYDKPFVCCYIKYYSKFIDFSIENIIACDLYCSLLYEINAENLYFSKDVGTFFYIAQNSCNELIIYVHGYNDILVKFLNDIKNNMFDYENMKNVFDKVKNEYIENLKSFKYIDSYSLVKRILHKYTNKNYYFPYEKLKVVNNITFNDVVSVIDKIFKNASTEFFVCGNYNDEIINILKSNFNYDNKKNKLLKLKQFVTDINKGEQIKITKKTLNKKEINSAINITFQIYRIKNDFFGKGKKIMCYTSLLKSILSERFFDILRTKKQYGYIVKCSNFKIDCDENPLYCMSFIIQTTKNIKEVEFAIFQFIDNALQMIENINDHDFDLYKQTIINFLEKKFETIEEEFVFFSDLLLSKTFFPGYKNEMIKIFKKITKQNIINFYKKYFVNRNTRSLWNIKIVAQK